MIALPLRPCDLCIGPPACACNELAPVLSELAIGRCLERCKTVSYASRGTLATSAPGHTG